MASSGRGWEETSQARVRGGGGKMDGSAKKLSKYALMMHCSYFNSCQGINIF